MPPPTPPSFLHPLPPPSQTTPFSPPNPNSDPDLSDTESLTDSQITSLLAVAEARLNHQSKHPQQSAKQSEELSSHHSLFGTDPATTQTAKLSRLNTGKIAEPYVSSVNGVAKIDSRRCVGKRDREGAERGRRVGMVDVGKRQPLTAGAQWYDLPATDPGLKRDLQLLNLRGVLDPHRHYKKESSKSSLPPFAQQGTIIEGPTEYHTGRIPKKRRHQTLVDEVLAGEYQTGKFRAKYGEIQDKKSSGKKGHYKALKAKRRRA